MKKILRVVTLIITVSLLVSCGNKRGVNYEELTDLPYYEYLNESNPIVTIDVKGYGVMEVELFPELVKLTVDNFLSYVLDESYTNSSFHRIIENFMIQGGIVNTNKPPIIGEFSSNGVANDLKHVKGVISMARTNVFNSATSQFFIVHKDSPHLNGEYAGFGGLISGFDVLDKIAEVKTGYEDAPLKEVVITKITVDLRGYEVSWKVLIKIIE